MLPQQWMNLLYEEMLISGVETRKVQQIHANMKTLEELVAFLMIGGFSLKP